MYTLLILIYDKKCRHKEEIHFLFKIKMKKTIPVTRSFIHVKQCNLSPYLFFTVYFYNPQISWRVHKI